VASFSEAGEAIRRLKQQHHAGSGESTYLLTFQRSTKRADRGGGGSGGGGGSSKLNGGAGWARWLLLWCLTGMHAAARDLRCSPSNAPIL